MTYLSLMHDDTQSTILWVVGLVAVAILIAVVWHHGGLELEIKSLTLRI